ncbi:uncharacterized protein LOC143631656 [Bidens hawaiensis]|uniref:uncharacterized protein LOC143631656 n=1 Tax=Bidens hawaiensis TaxID=980011 RepID=UPI00404AC1C9
MSSGDNDTPMSIPYMLAQEFQLLISDDVEDLAMQFFELDHEKESGSSQRKKKRKEIDRGRKDADAHLWNDYFALSPVYDESFFRRRFRMSLRLFNALLPTYQKQVERVCHEDKNTADQCDEYIRIGESTALECLHKFCWYIMEVYATKYLRRPTKDDINQLVEEHSTVHGFPGMLGSIDCMHWAWRNCPTAWKGQYTRGDRGHPTIMLEAVASHDLWIWHAFFRVAGSNNDISVLNQSPLFNQILEGTARECNFTVNGNVYTKEYYLVDGIYPKWTTLVKSFQHPPANNLKMMFLTDAKSLQERMWKEHLVSFKLGGE